MLSFPSTSFCLASIPQLRKVTFWWLTQLSLKARRIEVIVRHICQPARSCMLIRLAVVAPIKLRRTKVKFIAGATLDITSYDIPNDPNLLKGLPSKLTEMPAVVVPQGLDQESPYSEIIVPEYFPPGSIMVFETQLQDYDNTLDTFCASGAQEVFGALDLVELNVVLHRADGEERDATGGEYGAYDVPGLDKNVYCGLEGWMHPLRHVIRNNDLGHPLCGHLRDGSWAFDYVQSRLSKSVSYCFVLNTC